MSGSQNTPPDRHQTENVPSSGGGRQMRQQVEKTITNLADRYGDEPWFGSALGQVEAQFHELSLGSEQQSCLQRKGNIVTLMRSNQQAGARSPT